MQCRFPLKQPLTAESLKLSRITSFSPLSLDRKTMYMDHSELGPLKKLWLHCWEFCHYWGKAQEKSERNGVRGEREMKAESMSQGQLSKSISSNVILSHFTIINGPLISGNGPKNIHILWPMKLDLNKELVLWKHVTCIAHKEPCDSMCFEWNTNLTF